MDRRSWLSLVGMGIFASRLVAARTSAFDSTSRILLQGNPVIKECNISRNRRGFWQVQTFTTTFGSSTTFPKGTTQQEIEGWARKFGRLIGVPVVVQ